MRGKGLDAVGPRRHAGAHLVVASGAEIADDEPGDAPLFDEKAHRLVAGAQFDTRGDGVFGEPEIEAFAVDDETDAGRARPEGPSVWRDDQDAVDGRADDGVVEVEVAFHLAARPDGLGAAHGIAHAGALLEKEHAATAVGGPPRETRAGGTGADDDDVDFGRFHQKR